MKHLVSQCGTCNFVISKELPDGGEAQATSIFHCNAPEKPTLEIFPHHTWCPALPTKSRIVHGEIVNKELTS